MAVPQGDVTRDDLHLRFSAQHSVVMLEQCCSDSKQCCNNAVMLCCVKVARHSFSRSIPPKFERKLRRHKQGFGKIDTTVVLDKEENWL